MRKAEITMQGVPAGILEEIEIGRVYRFRYDARYVVTSFMLCDLFYSNQRKKSFKSFLFLFIHFFPFISVYFYL
jgi:hypothetical protein